MSLIRNISKNVGRLWRLQHLINSVKRPYMVPLYHTISDEPMSHIDPLYRPRTIDQFRKDINAFLKYYEPVTLEELVRVLKGERQTKKPAIHITFDDGLSEVYEHAMPILLAKGVPATVFINTDFVDNKGLFFRYKVGLILDQLQNVSKTESVKVKTLLGGKKLNQLKHRDNQLIDEISGILGLDFESYLRVQKPYMTTSQLQDWASKGFTVGGHSTDHMKYGDLSEEQQKEDYTKCMNEVDRMIKVSTRSFAFPFNDERVSKNTLEWMRKEQNCGLTFGISGLKDDYHASHIHRIPMEDFSWNAEDILRSEYLYYKMKAPFGKNKIDRP